MIAEQKAEDILKDFFGFDSFKGNQKEIVDSVIAGRDTFVIMPTGGGKSLCYQLPAIMSEGTAIIISPLIALMKNQVDLIQAFGSKTGVAHFMNSSLTKKQTDKVKEDVLSGNTKMLYIAPESLTKEETVNFINQVKVPFVAVDEAHCISEWGHDFRPEYRRIRQIVDAIGGAPVIALTASATPKVQEDILKNLKMQNANVFYASFNRPNLYYTVRPKPTRQQAVKELTSILSKNKGKSAIVYCLSRKTVEELAETLKINGINALPYHAGMDASTRTRHQDRFLMEDVDVIVATIAFGMGIDKPDVRFVVHFDVPKSLESYYQETGRGGRDGIICECVLYYNNADLSKLEKFLKDKPVAEREVGTLLLNEMASFSESSACRRKALLHYFGEEFDADDCHKMCDNCRNPRERFDAKKEMKLVLQSVKMLEDQFQPDHIIDFLRGEKSDQIIKRRNDELELFGEGEGKDRNFWRSIVRHATLEGYLKKDIESYGKLSLTEEGEKYLKKPTTFMMSEDVNFEDAPVVDEPEGGIGYDETLFNLLKDVRKIVAKDKKVPPYIVFQDPSLEEMAIKYPISQKELSQIVGVSVGKAAKYGTKFLEVISNYVEENDIDRPDDFVVKSVPNKSANKVYIIQNIDKKMNLDDIARSKGMTMVELMEEIENIVYSGTKLNLDYYINDILDEEYQEEVFDYFRTSESSSLEKALQDLGTDVYTLEEIQLMHIKFISEMAN
ncbi:MAG: DNA helicase RecQ [Bacteroidia bacterium]